MTQHVAFDLPLTFLSEMYVSMRARANVLSGNLQSNMSRDAEKRPDVIMLEHSDGKRSARIVSVQAKKNVHRDQEERVRWLASEKNDLSPL